jgi:predicted enzyme related to lactoylglutathione lyase
MTPKCYRVVIPVHDVSAAAEFYAHLFATTGERVSPGRHYIDAGGVMLALYSPEEDGDALAGGWYFHPSQYFYFSVENLDDMEARVRAAGGEVMAPIVIQPWGERTLYVRDPFGTPLCFVDQSTLFTGGVSHDFRAAG